MKNRANIANKKNISKQEIEVKTIEFSKKIVSFSQLTFVLQLIFTYSLIVLDTDARSVAVNALQVSIPFYIAIVVGYFGKAGVENSQKIKYWEEPEVTCLASESEIDSEISP